MEPFNNFLIKLYDPYEKYSIYIFSVIVYSIV